MKPGQRLTCEKAQVLLERSGAELPAEFEVDMVCRYGDTYVARWEDLTAGSVNAKSVSDPDDPSAARKSYMKAATVGFTEIWFNEDEDGRESVVCETVTAEEASSALKASGEKLLVVDARN